MNAKSKAFAFISAALMIGGAFICCSLIGDDSSADGTQYLTFTVGNYVSWDYDTYGLSDSFNISGSVPGLSITSDYDMDADVTLLFIRGTPTTAGSYNVNASAGGWALHLNITVQTNNYTVSFNSMGGTAVASQSVSPGGHATQPANPANGVKVFGGWFTDQACTQAFNFSTSINSNITLYAKWTTPSASVTSSHGNSSMVVGQYFSYNVSTNPGNATVSVSGANWLNVSGHTVYGTPTSPGTYNVTITSSASGYNNGSQSFTVTVSSVLAPSNAPSNGVIAYVR